MSLFTIKCKLHHLARPIHEYSAMYVYIYIRKHKLLKTVMLMLRRGDNYEIYV